MEVPWKNSNEFILFYNEYFKSDDYISIANFNYFDKPILNISSNKGYDMLNTWLCTYNNNKIIILSSTLSLINIINYNITEFSKVDYNNDIELNSINAHNLIQIVNQIIDELKKKRKLSQNMFEISRQINFPEYIIDLRHSATHKQTSNNLTMFKAFIDCLKYLKEYYFDKQYEIYKTEIEYYNYIIDSINRNEVYDNKLYSEVKLEFINVKNIMRLLFNNILQMT